MRDDAGLPEGPQDLDMERALLALVLADNAALDRLGKLDADDFADPMNAVTLEAMRELRLNDRPVNLVTMQAKLGGAVFADGMAGLDALRQFSFAGVPPDAHDLAKGIRDKSLRRQIAQLGNDTTAAAWNEADAPSAIIVARIAELDKLLDKCRPAGQVQWTSREAGEDMTDFALNPPEDNRIDTNISDLDRMLGGLGRGEFSILAGRPSMGKSAVAVCFSKGAARLGHGVLVFSLEMSARAWAARMASDSAWGYRSPLAYSDALRHKLDDRGIDRLVRGAMDNMDLPMVINEQAGLTVAEIAAITRQEAQKFERQGTRLGLVIVDHLGKIKPTSYVNDRVREVGAISNALAALAKREDVAMLALCQLNRGVESRDNKRPAMSDLRESGDLEQDADCVMFAYRHAYYLERQKEDDPGKEADRLAMLEGCKGTLEINIAKQRNGMVGSVPLFIDMPSNAVRNLHVGNG
jgi:replicative DNA helicase